MTTILIVEDEDDLRLLLRLSLASEPFEILEAATAAEAAEHWPHANLVLLDISLPDSNGLHLLTRLGKSGVPVIAISAHSGVDFREAAIDAGCVAYLTKPYLPAELLAAIAEHLPPGPEAASS